MIKIISKSYSKCINIFPDWNSIDWSEMKYLFFSIKLNLSSLLLSITSYARPSLDKVSLSLSFSQFSQAIIMFLYLCWFYIHRGLKLIYIYIWVNLILNIDFFVIPFKYCTRICSRFIILIFFFYISIYQ